MKISQNTQYALIAAATVAAIYFIHSDGTALAITTPIVIAGAVAVFVLL
jgi:hypothetical protein